MPQTPRSKNSLGQVKRRLHGGLLIALVTIVGAGIGGKKDSSRSILLFQPISLS